MADPDRRKLRIDGDELLAGMTAGRDDPFTHFLDLRTGEILMVNFDPLEPNDLDQELAKRIHDEHAHFLELERIETHERYDLMAQFADTVDEPDIRDQLAVALQGKGAFGRFKGVLHRYPDLLAAWRAFEHEQLVAMARRWLDAHELDVELEFARPIERVPPPARESAEPKPPRIGLLELLVLGAPDGKTELIDGRVHRVVRAPTPAEARHTFKNVARELCGFFGVAWRNSLVDGKDEIEQAGHRLHVSGDLVTLEFKATIDLFKRFM